MLAPDPEQVVVELESDAERPTEGAIAGDHRLVAGRQDGPGFDRGGDKGRRLAPDHVEVEFHGHRLGALAGPNVEVLAFTQRQAGVVVKTHQPQNLGVGEAELGQAM